MRDASAITCLVRTNSVQLSHARTVDRAADVLRLTRSEAGIAEFAHDGIDRMAPLPAASSDRAFASAHAWILFGSRLAVGYSWPSDRARDGHATASQGRCRARLQAGWSRRRSKPISRHSLQRPGNSDPNGPRAWVHHPAGVSTSSDPVAPTGVELSRSRRVGRVAAGMPAEEGRAGWLGRVAGPGRGGWAGRGGWPGRAGPGRVAGLGRVAGPGRAGPGSAGEPAALRVARVSELGPWLRAPSGRRTGSARGSGSGRTRAAGRGRASGRAGSG